MAFDAEAFHKELDKALNIAEGVHDATEVQAVVRSQAGDQILVARCPHCRTVAALSGEGKHLCRGCYKWLKYVQTE